MKKIFKSILLVSVIASLAACTKGFEQLNQHEYWPSDEQMAQDGLAVGSLFQALQRSVFVHGDNRDSDYQIAYNLCADTWVGYTTPTKTFDSGHFHDAWDFCDQYCQALFNMKNTSVIGSYAEFVKSATELNMENELALATVIRVASMHQVADYYGPIAYSTTGSLTNTYDPLDKVYEQFFEELDSSIEILEKVATSGGKLMEDYDIVYNGDAAKWVKFANSLRLRLAMRVRYANEQLAREEAEKSINSPGGLIEANSENAVYAEPNKLHFLHEIGLVFNNNGGDAHLNASLDSYLNGYNDPRKFKFASAAADGNVHGVYPGIGVSSYTNYLNAAGKVSPLNAAAYNITWINAAEVAFLRAEGALVGWNMGGSAQDFYEQGITLSFEEWGADGAMAYIADKTSKPADFKDNVGRNSAPATSTVTIAWSEGDDLETKLEKIGTQKWLALFPNGCEAWAEYRRLHYPKIFPPKRNLSNDTVNINQGVRRVPYPENEKNTNPEGYASGVAALGGPDTGGTRLWWDQKPFIY